jgi:hypothetical protein
MNNPHNKPGFRFATRRFTCALTIGLGVGLATRNIGVGIALGLVFFVSASGNFWAAHKVTGQLKQSPR